MIARSAPLSTRRHWVARSLTGLVLVAGLAACSSAAAAPPATTATTVATTPAPTTAASTTSPATTVAPTEAPTTEPATTAVPSTVPATTAAPVTPETLATAPATTQPPATEPPATQPPATEPPATEPPATEPPVVTAPPKADVTWGGWDYWKVPQLGKEPVRGSGCGANGQLGATLPDGVWMVLIGGAGENPVAGAWTAEQMKVDVVCVYHGAAGQQLLDKACAQGDMADGCLDADPDFYFVNNNTKLRTMPVAPDVHYGIGNLGAKSTPACTGATPAEDEWKYYASWIVVSGGVVTDVVAPCAYG